MGLSPRTRGNPTLYKLTWKPWGPIPANAGEPAGNLPAQGGQWAYPRERGGTASSVTVTVVFPGLSPRTRGNRGVFRRGLHGQGPIPANAGEPGPMDAGGEGGRAYPRERGGTGGSPESACRQMGLSPRTRGNRDLCEIITAWRGPIPANAGEPTRCAPLAAASGAYPRERGGTSSVVVG